MTAYESMTQGEANPSLDLLKRQRSHVLVVTGNAKSGAESSFVEWYQGPYGRAVLEDPKVLSVQHYEQHEVDITGGHFERLPYHYLSLCELSLDGAEEAAGLIGRITILHREQPAAEAPATWLYYPSCERVGRSPAAHPSMMTLAFANAVPGHEAEFREWYATRHIRHALHISALVSGQCLSRTCFQQPGAAAAAFSTIAIYEQEGAPEAFMRSAASLPDGLLSFPTLDLAPSRFAESLYRPL